ncbi:MAG: SAM-dependent chlorinase/fluorinase, partial [Rhodothermales bacterium]
ITLTTDFGTQDAYVGAMKGVILGLNPEVRLVDISHRISAQDVMEAAFVLKDAVFYYPAGTVHLAVVDPGVGTNRRAVALRCERHFFVGPDNGLFPLLLGERKPDEIVVLDRPEYWRDGAISASFHGRDIFAPVAAHLSLARPLAEMGSAVDSLAPMYWALPIVDDQGVQGWVVHIDHFGNCITNVSRQILEERRSGRPVKCFVGNAILEGMSRTYGDMEPGEPLMHFNSGDMLEIAVNSGNAAELLGIRKGASVNLLFRDHR